MKITEVQSFLMSYALPEPMRMPFWGGERTIVKRDAMLIRVKTDTGLIGYAPGPAHERAQKEIHNVIRPFLLGKDPRQWAEFDISALGSVSERSADIPVRSNLNNQQAQSSSSDVITSPSPIGWERAGVRARAEWEHSEIIKTYRAVEIALMDLTARYEECPLSEIIGGRKRDRIKLYGSAGMYMSPEGYAKEADIIAKMGFSAYKMRPALGPDDDLRAVELMRKTVGPNVGIMIDAHSWWRMGDKSYSTKTVTDLAREIAKFNPTWLEEPLPPDNHDAYRTLRAQKILPIATGEHEQEEKGFYDLIETGAADYIQMDVCCQGGFAMGQRIFASVQRKNLRFAFHSWGTALEVLAAAHLGVCWPADVVEWLEYPIYTKPNRPVMYPWPLAEEILREPFEIDHGDMFVPKAPGLGIEIDERVIEKYPFIPGPWSFFRIDSPLETVAVTGDHSVKWVSAENPL